MPSVPPPPVLLIVRLPYNRPQENAPPEPPPVEWNAEKERILWDALAHFRTQDNIGGTGPDWPTLSTRLQVPLPYLLYRTKARYEHDLDGIERITNAVGHRRSFDEVRHADDRPPSSASQRRMTPTPHLGPSRLSSSVRNLPTPPRLVRDHDSLSSSTLTLQSPQRGRYPRPAFGLPEVVDNEEDSQSSESSEEEAEKAEEEERKREADRKIEQRVKELEKMVQSDMLGFARPPLAAIAAGGKGKDRRNMGSPRAMTPTTPTTPSSPHPRGGFPFDTARKSAPQSPVPQSPNRPDETASSTSSLPSPASDSSHAIGIGGRAPLPGPSSYSSRHQVTKRLAPALSRARASERGSSISSEHSSFSDFSDTSLTTSALGEAIMSDIRGGGASRLSTFVRSNFTPRGTPHQ
ncbi:hypothetical protein BOTBODRAFT_38064 [Botryobasidium botryosum FD-172 SS1]|uniref:Autophagy-related protein 29 n=1 Tax=Botryobasidium botryosum (strain FD-172 SS1) TaxID=930990 RepID=A0A067M9F9_BOTB1|nr:hypothetical protein BOTBODRAFT_38064 [Botryobasidium botryosum FD-172 SS1]